MTAPNVLELFTRDRCPSRLVNDRSEPSYKISHDLQHPDTSSYPQLQALCGYQPIQQFFPRQSLVLMDNRLPPELLAHIFQLLRDIDSRSSLIVSWVSRHWRMVALSTCSLWDTITTFNSDMITEYINRNPISPITLTVVCQSHKSGVASECLRLVITRHLQPRLQNIRVRVVSDSLATVEDTELWQKTLRTLFLPGFRGYQQLRTLSIGFTSKYIGDPTASDGLHMFAEAPELRNLRLRGLAIRSENCASGYPLLKAFSITNVHLDRSIQFFLRKMPKLEQLSLILIERYGTEPSATDAIDALSSGDELELNNLRQLRILRPMEDQISDIHSLLTLLRAPNLRHFEWEVNYYPMATPLSFWQHCASRFHTLTSLHLMGFPSETSGAISATQVLLGWLDFLPLLESFILVYDQSYIFSSIETQLGTIAILEPLAETYDDAPMRCPHLSCLHIGPIRPRELLNIELVARARPRLRAGTLRIVQYVDTKRTAGDASWLQTNVSDFALETVVGHGRGFRYGFRYRYVGGILRKFTSPYFERLYFDQTEQSELLV